MLSDSTRKLFTKSWNIFYLLQDFLRLLQNTAMSLSVGFGHFVSTLLLKDVYSRIYNLHLKYASSRVIHIYALKMAMNKPSVFTISCKTLLMFAALY
jgi:hypothetical protein